MEWVLVAILAIVLYAPNAEDKIDNVTICVLSSCDRVNGIGQDSNISVEGQQDCVPELSD